VFRGLSASFSISISISVMNVSVSQLSICSNSILDSIFYFLLSNTSTIFLRGSPLFLLFRSFGFPTPPSLLSYSQSSVPAAYLSLQLPSATVANTSRLAKSSKLLHLGRCLLTIRELFDIRCLSVLGRRRPFEFGRGETDGRESLDEG